MTQKFDKLVGLLKELFQLDQPDLDFGLYRIMHAKAGEITQFLEKDLLPQVKTAFSEYQTADKGELEKELAKAIEQAQGLGVDPETTQKVKDLRAKLADEAVDVGGLENEVYDHLFSFFRRYYSEGDFMAKRVYKPGVYAIPYEGEEVKLHWANRDQYYIKTSEYLRDYAFTLKPHNEKNPMRVHFKLVDAAEGEHGNIKATNGDRVFILAPGGESGHDFVTEEDGELVIRFEYRPARIDDWSDEAKEMATAAAKKKPPVQSVLLNEAASIIQSVAAVAFQKWVAELAKPHIKTDGEKADYTRLEAHLRRYSARNTFDYFIHKDLGDFLRRELDFYIKNEVMHLDDIEHETVPRVEQYLSKIKVIRKIAGKVIDFLAQLEDFQKSLWLKKKFVVETNYCITLDRIPEEFYLEIASNDAQRNEWVRLFAIDTLAGDKLGEAAYSDPLTKEFLIAHKYLPVDTVFLTNTLKARILASIEDIDEQTSGLLVNADNYQAIRLLQRRYRERVKCIYIDPPYNSPSSEIAYKNNYKHASWLSLMHDRMDESRILSTADGSCVIAIDENEHNGLERLCMELYPKCDITTVGIEHNRKGIQGSQFSYTNEFAVFVIPPELRSLNRALLPKEEWEYANLRNWGGESLRTDGRNCFYPVHVKNDAVVGFGDVCEDEYHPKGGNVDLGNGTIAVYPIDADGVERKWRYARDSVESIKQLLKVDTARSGDLQIMKAKADAQFKTMWYAPKYNAGDYGTKLLTNMGFEKGLFDFPKSLHTVRDSIFAVTGPTDITMDYFAGSGTTGHAVISLNRGDDGKRRYILVEMGSYFDTVTKPRLLKAAYSENWKEGRPISDSGSISHIVKYIRLESYEDALNNLTAQRTEMQKSLLESSGAQDKGDLKEEYMLRYMLDMDTQGSQSLLNFEAFKDPTAYKLKVKLPNSDSSEEMDIDLLETFNYLVGMTVKHVSTPQSFSANFERDGEGRLGFKGRMRPDETGRWRFQAVTGITPNNSHALVIWRKLTGNPEQDNLVLNEWFTKQGFSTRDYEFGLIYVNGDNNLENLKKPDDTWKVRLIEEDFHRLMFDIEEP